MQPSQAQFCAAQFSAAQFSAAQFNPATKRPEDPGGILGILATLARFERATTSFGG